uniref:Dynamin-2A-like isoform X1 n=1 Tax=Tanacetum cinerariifolium TaxID=118510 RepID=A0A699GZI7_TANCI|nr:dynamin-2A-like isoform X1 [Tanacetum cinerariifolium]
MARKPADPEEELRWMAQEVRGYVEAVYSCIHTDAEDHLRLLKPSTKLDSPFFTMEGSGVAFHKTRESTFANWRCPILASFPICIASLPPAFA